MYVILYIYCMLVREIWKFIHPRVLYSLRATPEGNMILTRGWINFHISWTRIQNENTWSHRTKIIFREIKIIFHPLGSLVGFPARAIVLSQENVRGTRNASYYENVFTQEYHIPWGQRPRGIWYSWVNKFSYFPNLHAINVLLYRMKPRKHIHTAGKHILSPLERCLRIWCVNKVPI
jgi:hypothetical protein